MLPRKLRVTRAKSIKRNVKSGSSAVKAPQHNKGATTGYTRKLTAEQQSQMGRAGKLLGRAAASQMRSGTDKAPGGKTNPNNQELGQKGLRAPESFVFEGHRATRKSGKSGLKLGGAGKKASKKVGKPTTRSSKRGTAWKASGGNKKSK